jgi:hypothetical protein
MRFKMQNEAAADFDLKFILRQQKLNWGYKSLQNEIYIERGL